MQDIKNLKRKVDEYSEKIRGLQQAGAGLTEINYWRRELNRAHERIRECDEGQLDRLVMPPILDACCGGRMFWWDKQNENVYFADKREVDKGQFANGWNPNWCVKPDGIHDFRNMPYKDKTFKMVVFDPPHLTSGSEKSVINTKYGLLNKATWKADIVAGFSECWRVLDDYGVLVFKWSESNIKAKELLREFPVEPLFGDFTGRTGKTIWVTFMKVPDTA